MCRLARAQDSTYKVEEHSLADAQRALRLLRSRASDWALDPNPIGIMGFSAGGALAVQADFGNWEHGYHLFHGLEPVMPYTPTHVHAKYWDRWKTAEKDWNDVVRCVSILNAHRFKGTICLEYEQGSWDGVEGSQRLMKDVLAAL